MAVIVFVSTRSPGKLTQSVFHSVTIGAVIRSHSVRSLREWC